MKKLLIFFIVAILSTTYINAQSLLISWEGNPLPDTIMAYAHPDSTDAIVFRASVTNNTGNIMNVKLARVNIDLLEGTSNSVCFAGTCYGPMVDTTEYLTLTAGATSGDDRSMEADYYYPVGSYGKSIVKYSFFNMANPEEHADIVVKYWSSPTAIDENIADNIVLSNIYPNPAKQSVSLDYRFDVNVDAASVKIVNLLGSVVKEIEMNQNAGKISIDISDLNNGIYFYSVVVNNEVLKTKKLVIR